MRGSALPPPPRPHVVKLGGSLLGSAELRSWLALLARLPGPPRVLVPGGGPFADAVRSAQARLGFDDLAAHRMAILAMQQHGLLLQALEPGLGLAESWAELLGLAPGTAAVWLPWRLAGREEGIEASWAVTSDSLALWLAKRLRAPRLLLVKSAPVPEEPFAAERLAAAGIVDAAFPALARDYLGEVRCVGRSGHETAAGFLR